MNIPAIQGLIDRRILVNFSADPQTVLKLLPAPFRPKLHRDKAIVGICLIRLKQIQLKGMSLPFGIRSENAAHRIAVEWTQRGVAREGVFIPRRDTSSRLNTWAGGRIFPGVHHHSQFTVHENAGRYAVSFEHPDGTSVSVEANTTKQLDPNSVFGNLETASAFFEKGSMGYSPHGEQLDGLELRTFNWKVSPLNVSKISSSYFENKDLFPEGSLQFDHALLMTQIKHEWHSHGKMKLLDS